MTKEFNDYYDTIKEIEEMPSEEREPGRDLTETEKRLLEFSRRIATLWENPIFVALMNYIENTANPEILLNVKPENLLATRERIAGRREILDLCKKFVKIKEAYEKLIAQKKVKE